MICNNVNKKSLYYKYLKRKVLTLKPIKMEELEPNIISEVTHLTTLINQYLLLAPEDQWDFAALRTNIRAALNLNDIIAGNEQIEGLVVNTIKRSIKSSLDGLKLCSNDIVDVNHPLANAAQVIINRIDRFLRDNPLLYQDVLNVPLIPPLSDYESASSTHTVTGSSIDNLTANSSNE